MFDPFYHPFLQVMAPVIATPGNGYGPVWLRQRIADCPSSFY